MTAWYNEFDPFAAAWLRELIKEGFIAPGDVDERSIREVQPDDLRGYDQCHFFAGIGGWSYALRLAGWPDDRPVWTGSCPCQPFSAAGKRKGTADERHLWPEFNRLIGSVRPPIVFGEQVASKDGRQWLAGVRADLEALGYGVGAADLCAAGAGEEAEGRVSYEDNSFEWQRIVVGAPNIRQRIWWVADASQHGAEFLPGDVGKAPGVPQKERPEHGAAVSQRGSTTGRLGHPGSERRQQERRGPSGDEGADGRRPEGDHVATGSGAARGMGDADEPGSQGRIGRGDGAGERAAGPAGVGFWSDFDLIPCADGKARRVEPGTFPLAHGVPARVGRLRGYGNAINPWLAAEFIESVEEARWRAWVFGD